MKHPETKRREGKLAALYNRHEEQVKEMKKLCSPFTIR